MKIKILFTLLAYVMCYTIMAQGTCDPITQATSGINQGGVALYNCMNVSGAINPTQPCTILSGTQINVAGESSVWPSSTGSTQLIIENELLFVKQITANSNVQKNSKIEFGIRLPNSIETKVSNFIASPKMTPNLNPFDPLDIDIRAYFEKETSANVYQVKGYQYGFFYKEFSLDTTGPSLQWHRNEVPIQERFRVRYTPTETGNWRVRFTITVKGGTFLQSGYQYFTVLNSTKSGNVKVSADGNYFELDGKMFYGVGQNQSYPNCVSEYCADMNDGQWYYNNWDPEYLWDPYPLKKRVKAYRFYHQVINKMAEGGANHFRMLMDEGGLEIEYEKLGDYYDRLDMAWEMDKIFELSENLNLKMTFDMALHTRFENGSVYGTKEWDWPYDSCTKQGYCYNNIPGVDVPMDMFTNATAKRYYKNRLRYIISRYGYSTSIGWYEFMSEVNNIGQGIIFNNTWLPNEHKFYCDESGLYSPRVYDTESSTYCPLTYKWQTEMLGYIKNELQHNVHPMGVCYSGEPNIVAGDSSYFSPNVDYVGFNSGFIGLDRLRVSVEKVLYYKNDLHIIKPVLHSELTLYPYQGCDHFSEWYRNVWIPPFTGLTSSGNWYRQFHTAYPYLHIFGNLTSFLQESDYRNTNGYTWKPETVNAQAHDEAPTSLYYMKGEKNGGYKKAEGVLVSKNFNFFTSATSIADSVCRDIDSLILYSPLMFNEIDKNPRDIEHQDWPQVRIPDMGGLWNATQCYKVYWYDPITGEWIYTDTQNSNVTGHYLTLIHPTLTSRNPFNNGEPLLLSGIRPILAFKIRRCDEDAPSGIIAVDDINKRDIIIDLQTGMKNDLMNLKEESGSSIKIYPNPTSNTFRIEVSGNYESVSWILYSSTGSGLKNGMVTSSICEIDLSNYSAGLYWLKIIKVNGQVETFKIIKQ